MTNLRTIAIAALCIVMSMAATYSADAQESATGKYKKALFIGAHPDDNEASVGGTMLKLRQQGCEVVCVDLTHGEAGIEGKTHQEAAAIRTREAQAAARDFDVKLVMMTQIDGNTEVNKARYDEMKAVIAAEKPDVVFTHWPIDSHRDHRACSMLVYDAWRQLDHSFDLYYYETMTGLQTMGFMPDTYVDISDVVDKKYEACQHHVSQNINNSINNWHKPVDTMRGHEFHCKAAEAFKKQIWDKSEIMGQ